MEEEDGPPETASNTYNHSKQPNNRGLARFREHCLVEKELTGKLLYQF